ncbi:helix-turn-helix transcriptional regulator [Paenibacillus hexagrammi]|uniref:AraC family transcriptional regulator n=1 Tax=Paenibacillus hexagrammi TaxID=2908839 RepID=A0ABY3SLR0_9BACL|nr:AraC family transcriptional regulator [Paenibacillus sp. YPD9-1]UJF34654.1 AraC family transcriptional regulator [Paenibacillus sp. YPD9-1]
MAVTTFSYDVTPDCSSLVFGTGTVVRDIMDAHISFLAADGACQMGLFFDTTVVDGNRWLEISCVSDQFASEWSEGILPNSRNFENMLELWKEKGSSGWITPPVMKKTAVQWANRMMDIIEVDYGVNIEKVIGDRSKLIDTMLQASNWSLLMKECQELMNHVQFFLNVTKTTLKEKLVQEMKTYLETHYCENFQLDQLAEQFDLSSSYISNLYSKPTGQTILEYTTSLRIQKSKQLLRESSLKISKISKSVGYDNQRYFCHVFKKHVGISPGQYREEHMIQQ